MVKDFKQLKIVSFNMHGFNQGCATINEMIENMHPDVILCQEHWQTPNNLDKFDKSFTSYFSFGCSAMGKAVEYGIIRGRPFGGVMTLISNNLRNITETVYCAERCTIVRIANCIIVNIYLPCIGTIDRQLICQDLLSEIGAWINNFPSCNCVVAGDFNVNLDSTDNVANCINAFFVRKWFTSMRYFMQQN